MNIVRIKPIVILDISLKLSLRRECTSLDLDLVEELNFAAMIRAPFSNNQVKP